LGLIAATGSRRDFRRHVAVIERIATEVSRETAEVRAAEENRETVNRDQPDGERLEADFRLRFFPLDRGMHTLDIFGLAVIHALPGAVLWMVRFLPHFAALPGAGGAAGVVDFTSFKACD